MKLSLFFLSISLLVSACGCTANVVDESKQASSDEHLSTEGEKDAIRALIPEAAGIKLTDFQTLAESGGAPKESDVADKSLSLIILTLGCRPADSEEQQLEFSYASEGYPNASKIAEMFAEFKLESKTRGDLLLSITNDRITRFSCEIEGSNASGQFGYELPDLFRGSVNFLATKKNGSWSIVEFSMPSRQIQLRYSDGIWSRK